MSYPEHTLGESCPSAEMQSLYSAASGDWVRSIVANVLEFNIVISEFELQLRYYVHFGTNALGKGMNPLIHSYLGVKLYHCCSITRMTMALSSNKESKPNYPQRVSCYMTLNNLRVRLQYCWSFGECSVFIAIAPRSTLNRSGSIW